MNDLFKAPDQEPLPSIDESKDYLSELTGPGGKFDRTKYESEVDMYKAIAKGKVLADQTLELRNKQQDELRNYALQLREETNKQAKLEDMMTQINQRLASSNTPLANEDNPPKIDPEMIRAAVRESYQSERQAERQMDNFNGVTKKLKDTWGERFTTILENKAQELGLTKEEVNDMARNRPTVFYKTFDLNERSQPDNLFQSPPRNEQRRDSFAPQAPQKRTWAYYQNLKAKDPNAWLNPKTAVQMQEDALAQGEAFYDGNFYVKGLHEK